MMVVDRAALETLPPPREIVEFEACQPWESVISNFRVGRMVIHPRYAGAPAEKEIVAVRLEVPDTEKEYWPFYYDITPSRLVYQLIPLLKARIPEGMKLRIHRDVPGPGAHFEVSWVEIE